MITNQQLIGMGAVYIGCNLYCLFQMNINPIPQIVVFQPAISIAIMIAGGIMSYGWKEVDDLYLKVIGVNMNCLGLFFQGKGIFFDKSYASLILGILLATEGIIFVYLKKGKPSPSAIILQFCLGISLLVFNFVYFLYKLWTIESNWMDQELNEWPCVSLGVLQLMVGVFMCYIRKRKIEGDLVEPDVNIFFISNHTYQQIKQ